MFQGRNVRSSGVIEESSFYGRGDTFAGYRHRSYLGYVRCRRRGVAASSTGSAAERSGNAREQGSERVLWRDVVSRLCRLPRSREES